MNNERQSASENKKIRNTTLYFFANLTGFFMGKFIFINDKLHLQDFVIS